VQIMAGLALALIPLFLLLADVRADRLTANPVQELEQQTGKAAYLLLLLSLAVTPAMRLLQALRLLPGTVGREALGPLRRLLGWAALSWAVAHFLVFLGLDYGFDPRLLWGAIAEKRFALVGLAALLLLLLRAFLPRWRRRRERGVRQARPHWAVRVATPLAAALVALHYLWAVKTVTGKEVAYAVATALLLGAWALNSRSR
jgi:sulfoxide reductase heme-binding subunit YedZ